MKGQQVGIILHWGNVHTDGGDADGELRLRRLDIYFYFR